ncbi:MAG TPA: hypothetical protein VFC00_02625 [Micromonosporaceae bacterium]|nr:hypothetical protein [Micromonosporaceae bacterium]
MGVWYATREDVKSALDSRETARNDAQVDRAIEGSSRSVEGQLRRRFYPELDTRYFDWPNFQYSRPWRLWLGANELISVSALVAGGTTIAASDYFLRRSDGKEEPPYTHIEVDLESSAVFQAGATHQRAIAVTGLFGHSADETAAGTLAEALDSAETGVDVSDGSLIGVGSIIKVDSERMIVTGRSALDTTVDIHGSDSLTALASDVSITLTTATNAPVAGEVILIDSERMLVVDVAGTTLTVKRAWDGSVLATHAAGAGIYAYRTLTVQRGALGTTAAAHDTAAPVTRHVVPGLVNQLCVAESLVSIQGELGAYAQRVGSGDNQRDAAGGGIDGIRAQAVRAYGRKMRKAAV